MDVSDNKPSKIIALAACAHPDDIEFMMAGTLLLLKKNGAEIHMWNLSSGHCGSNEFDAEKTSRVRWQEAQDSARLAGATIHPPITRDIDILYTKELIAQVSSVIRQVKPTILLVPSPQDYMEDHQTACRLLVTGAFTRNMRNYETDPPAEMYSDPVTIYHAMPHGFRDSMRRLVRAEMYVDICSVLRQKREMLACHKSQKEWLDTSQGIDAYLNLMESFAHTAGTMSGCFTCAEGWRRHAHWGYSSEDFDPLSETLGHLCHIDPNYKQSLG
ncbi:MAG: PIG-L family deacetylase [Candidatus Latescibacteria bacterium]|nr:PIG-L family deacetylase [Candidatus Latescibacterota bacterium]